MKKLFFMAAVAGVALASCTKNEMAPTVENQAEITFSTPVVAPATKDIVETAVYPEDEHFGVYAWHSSTDAAYMDGIEVARDENLKDDFTGEAQELGGWKPTQSYYWPKEGSLVFDAFSPWSVNDKVSATKAKGITITSYVVAEAADVDLMFATRTPEKTSVNDQQNAGIPYDGVDIAFNHALAAVQLKARTQSDYSSTTEIIITDIKIVKAANTGTFNQNVGETAGWQSQTGDATYTYTNQTVTYGGVDCGTKILLPQDFSDDLAANITYTINGISNTGTFKFKDHSNGKNDEVDVTVDSWDMGIKYVYTLVFTLNEIYFEPIVSKWDEIIVTEGAVKNE